MSFYYYFIEHFILFFHLVSHYAYLQCAGGARSHYEDMGIADSNTHAQNNTSHLSPKVIVADQTVLEESNIRTSAKKNPLIPLSSKNFSSVGSTMSTAAVSSPGPGGPTGVRQNLNELDVLLEDLSKAR